MMTYWALLLVLIATCYLPVLAAGARASGSAVSPQAKAPNLICDNPYVRTFTRSSSGAELNTTQRAVAGQPQSGARQRQSAGSVRGYGIGAASTNASGMHAPIGNTAPTAGAGKSYDFTDGVMSSGVKRTFIVHVPASYNRARPMAVVCAFHGLSMTGAMMMYMTNLDYYADKMGFIVVYPNANGGRWDDGRSGNSDDVQFVTDMLAKLASQVNIDQRRIYAAGISNGGHFIQYLAGQSRRFAAIAVVASAAMAGAANASAGHRMPIVLFLGTDDPLVPSSDPSHNATLGKLGDAVGLSNLGSLSEPIAKLGGVMTSEETVDFWVRNNGCSSSPYTVQMPDKDPGDGTKVTRYSYGGYGSEVVYYSIHGGGHSWPGSLVSIGAKDILGRTSLDINASELIADFFMHH